MYTEEHVFYIDQKTWTTTTTNSDKKGQGHRKKGMAARRKDSARDPS